MEGSRHHRDRTLTKVSFDLRRLFCNRKRSPKRWKSPRQLLLSLITFRRARIYFATHLLLLRPLWKMRQRTSLAWNYRTLQWGKNFWESKWTTWKIKLDWSIFKLEFSRRIPFEVDSSLTVRVSNYATVFKKETFWSGLRLGRSLVPNLHDLWGIKSQTSSGTWWGRSTSRSLIDCPDQLKTMMEGVEGKSATWSNTWISAPTTWSWHCWTPSWKIQPAPQSFKGCRSHL